MHLAVLSAGFAGPLPRHAGDHGEIVPRTGAAGIGAGRGGEFRRCIGLWGQTTGALAFFKNVATDLSPRDGDRVASGHGRRTG